MRNDLSPLCFLAVAVCLVGCERRLDQYEVEAKFAQAVTRLLRFHEVEHPGVQATNLSQLFSVVDQGYPHYWHRQLSAFGKSAGFTNSVYEKYAAVSPPITNRWIQGSLIMVSAQPFPGPRGDLERYAISKTSVGFRHATLQEEQTKLVFREAGVIEPKPPTMPPPPLPPLEEAHQPEMRTQIQIFFARFAGSVGLRPEHGALLMYASVGVSFLLVVTLLWFGRRGRH